MIFDMVSTTEGREGTHTALGVFPRSHHPDLIIYPAYTMEILEWLRTQAPDAFSVRLPRDLVPAQVVVDLAAHFRLVFGENVAQAITQKPGQLAAVLIQLLESLRPPRMPWDAPVTQTLVLVLDTSVAVEAVLAVLDQHCAGEAEPRRDRYVLVDAVGEEQVVAYHAGHWFELPRGPGSASERLLSHALLPPSPPASPSSEPTDRLRRSTEHTLGRAVGDHARAVLLDVRGRNWARIWELVAPLLMVRVHVPVLVRAQRDVVFRPHPLGVAATQAMYARLPPACVPLVTDAHLMAEFLYLSAVVETAYGRWCSLGGMLGGLERRVLKALGRARGDTETAAHAALTQSFVVVNYRKLQERASLSVLVIREAYLTWACPRVTQDELDGALGDPLAYARLLAPRLHPFTSWDAHQQHADHAVQRWRVLVSGRTGSPTSKAAETQRQASVAASAARRAQEIEETHAQMQREHGWRKR